VVVAAAFGVGLLGVGWLGVSGAPPASGSGASQILSSPDLGSGQPIAAGSAGRSFVPASSATGSAAASSSPAASDQPAARGATEAALQGVLDRVRVKLAIPGVSATVIFPDGTAWTGVSGFAKVATATPVRPETAFAVASMSKTFTSAEILSLVGEGRLRLADSAAAVLPAGLPIRLDPRITVAMLLDHTSGLADFFLSPTIDVALQRAPNRSWSAADALRFVGKPLSRPGVAWHYSNTNYLLLGLIAEHVTGHTLADEIRRRFLDPLNLSDSWYQSAETPRVTIADGYRVVSTKPAAKPIDLSDGSGIAPFRSVVTAAGGAGSIAATSTDLAHWARALYTGDVLGPAGTALLLSDFRKTTGYLPGVSYGYGVQALVIDGHPSLGHSGKLLGFRGAVRHFSLDGITIAVLTNQSRADPAAVVRSLLRVVVPPSPAVPVGSPSLSPSAAPSAPAP
jgi:D-alanyl-D-alanine carboxypeptidase